MHTGITTVSGQNFHVTLVGIYLNNYDTWNGPSDAAHFVMRSRCKTLFNTWENWQDTDVWYKKGTGEWKYSTTDEYGDQMNSVLKEPHGTCYDYSGIDIEWNLREFSGSINVVIGNKGFDMNGKTTKNYNIGCTDAICGGEGNSNNYFAVQVQLS